MQPDEQVYFQEGVNIRVASNIDWSQLAIGSNIVFPQAELTDRKAHEKAQLEKLIYTGFSELKMYSDGERLVVKGSDMNNVRTLFILDRTKMLAPKKRTSHLKAILTKLAQREGVELVITDQLPNFRVNQIVYWPFKVEMDDSALLVAKPRDRGLTDSDIYRVTDEVEDDYDSGEDLMPF